MKNQNYDRPEMEIITLNQEDVVTLSQGEDDGTTPQVDYKEIWG